MDDSKNNLERPKEGRNSRLPLNLKYAPTQNSNAKLGIKGIKQS
ncbi:MAG: hypothetical protein WBV84_02600 [Nitrososphaeraceae archaeon]